MNLALRPSFFYNIVNTFCHLAEIFCQMTEIFTALPSEYFDAYSHPFLHNFFRNLANYFIVNSVCRHIISLIELLTRLIIDHNFHIIIIDEWQKWLRSNRYSCCIQLYSVLWYDNITFQSKKSILYFYLTYKRLFSIQFPRFSLLISSRTYERILFLCTYI